MSGAASSVSRRWLAGVALGLLACLLILVLPVDSPAWVAVARGGTAVAVALFLVAALRMTGRVRVVWLALWSFQALTWVGDVLYNYYQYQTGDVPFPGPPDVFYLAAYASGFVGLVILVKDLNAGRDQIAWIDSVIITVAATSVVGVVIVAPSLAESSSLDWSSGLSLGYPLLDVVLLSALVRMLFSSRQVSRPMALLVASFALYLTADLVYNVRVATGLEDVTLAWLDVLYLAATVAMAAAATAPGATTILVPGAVDGSVTRPGRIVALALGSLTAPLLLLTTSWDEGGWEIRLLAVASVIIILLVLWRLMILLRTIEDQATRLAEQARTDGLTGLPNRRTWDFQLARAVDVAADRRTPLSVAMLDLDHFKAYNDVHGHPAADLVLIDCARAWAGYLPPSAFVARYGGEEFGVLLPGMRLDEAGPLLEGLRAVTPKATTVSIGVVELDADETREGCLVRADAALYLAKESGRDRVVAQA